MPVQMIGDILAAELAHMQPYIRFCSYQINGAVLLQTRIDNEPDFKDFLKVGSREEREHLCNTAPDLRRASVRRLEQ